MNFFACSCDFSFMAYNFEMEEPHGFHVPKSILETTKIDRQGRRDTRCSSRMSGRSVYSMGELPCLCKSNSEACSHTGLHSYDVHLKASTVCMTILVMRTSKIGVTHTGH